MERIAAVTNECFFIDQNKERVVMENSAVVTFIGILKDCLMLSGVIMIGATLALLLG